MRYETISYYNLKDYGINVLTGEACAFGMRLLCDLSEAGVALLTDFFGLCYRDIPFPRNMNSMVGDEPAIASCMLSRSILTEIYLFILFSKGWQVALIQNGEVTGMNINTYEEIKNAWPKDVTVRRNYKSASQPSVGSRNIHAFTGRIL